VACTFSDAPKDITVTPPIPSPSDDSDVSSLTRSSTKSRDEAEKASLSAHLANLTNVGNVLDLPESKSRRMLELRLMTNWQENLARPFKDHANAQLVTGWGEHVPQMALKHDNVLYMMYSCSAASLLRREPDDSDVAAAGDVYLGLGLREQHGAVAGLSMDNADSVCFTATLMVITSLARLWKRKLEPYSPPMEWLRLGNGAVTVLRAAKEILKQNPSSKMWLLINAPPVFDVQVLFARENLRPFSKMLEPERGRTTPEEFEAYEKALCYIGYAYQAVNEDEPIYIVARKVVSFAMFVPRSFVDLVEEERPFALVILAYYFAVMARYPSIWWVGQTPKREIQAIQAVLPDDYQEQMHWPLMITGLAMS
jgi:hypothetical protein